MEFKSFDDYIEHRLSKEEIDNIKKEAQQEYECSDDSICARHMQHPFCKKHATSNDIKWWNK